MRRLPQHDQPCAEFRSLRTSRRAVVQAGAAGLLGLGLPGLFAGQAAAGSIADNKQLPGFGKAKRCIFLFMWGGPSQLDTFDMKPNAPDNPRAVQTDQHEGARPANQRAL
jgi:Protein of unknown function (DUF1501)